MKIIDIVLFGEMILWAIIVISNMFLHFKIKKHIKSVMESSDDARKNLDEAKAIQHEMFRARQKLLNYCETCKALIKLKK